MAKDLLNKIYEAMFNNIYANFEGGETYVTGLNDALEAIVALPQVADLIAKSVANTTDREIAIGKHAFDSGYNSAAERAVLFHPTKVTNWAAHRERAWSGYTPPEDLCGGG